jgi:UDP-N-acetylglucosamine 4,6-dehydratase
MANMPIISRATKDNNAVLITGGTGSFGRAFTAHLLSLPNPPERIVIYSRDEHKQIDMRADPRFAGKRNLRFFVGDVRDDERLATAMRGIECVVHAAALKDVPTAEYNPLECLKTNVHGAENVVKAAIAQGVTKVIALSSDKAANPTTLYGASKLAADRVFIAANNWSGSAGTRFSVVRYGNVVGSRSSVVEVFEKLIAEGATSLPITDVRMTRFWITLEQAVEFVLSSIRMMVGGEIFVPKLPSMKVTELATAMAPNLPHRIVGIRPHEKLHEVLVTSDEARHTIELPDRYVIEPAIATFDRTAAWGGRPVHEGFEYDSYNNPRWMKVQGFRDILENHDNDLPRRAEAG